MWVEGCGVEVKVEAEVGLPLWRQLWEDVQVGWMWERRDRAHVGRTPHLVRHMVI